MAWNARQCVIALIVFQLLAWSLLPWLVNVSLPLDVVREGLSWGREFEWGYYKHPPLPSWLVEISFRMLGDIGPYFLSQTFIALTYLFVFLLGRRLMPEWKAAAGTLGLVGVSFFTWSSVEFNHNVAQMPLWAAAIYFLHTLLDRPALWRWFVLAVISAAGLYSKYSFAVLIALGFIFLLQTPYRQLVLSKGMGLFLVVLLALMLPHAIWLQNHNFLPFHYLDERAVDASSLFEQVLDPLNFLLVQGFNVLVLIVLMLCLGLRQLNASSPAFLRWFTFAPLLFVALVSLIMGEEPRAMWATPMLSLIGLWLAWHLPNDAEKRLRNLLVTVLCLSTIVLSAYAGKALWGDANSNKASRTGWPDVALANQAQAQWSLHTNCPLRIVSGDNWLAGLIAYRHPARPSVLVDGNFTLSTWLSALDADKRGFLLVWLEKDTPPDLSIELAEDALAAERIELAWPRASNLPPLVVFMQVVKPNNPACGPVSPERPSRL